jgi:hypothetical protein
MKPQRIDSLTEIQTFFGSAESQGIDQNSWSNDTPMPYSNLPQHLQRADKLLGGGEIQIPGYLRQSRF